MGVCITIGGFPILGDAACANAYRDDHRDKVEIKKDASVEKTEARQEGRSARTAARCGPDGRCGILNDAGDAVGGILGSLSSGLASGLAGPIPLIIGGVVLVGGGVLVYRMASK